MTERKVLVAVLNWGLGHAARCVPLIRALIDNGIRVVVASDGDALRLLRAELPLLTYHELPSYAIRYSRTAAGMPWRLIMQLPHVMKTISEEHQLINELVRKEKIHFIISDNRYGAYHPTIPSVWLGHQLHLIMPGGWTWLSGTVNRLHTNLINRFGAHWVPDLPGSPLSGRLSAFEKPVAYTGILSRFTVLDSLPDTSYAVVVVLSGPEPQRTLLEQKIRMQLPALPVRSLLVRGVPGNDLVRAKENYDEVDFLTARPLNRVLAAAALVVARSGYSTIMDLCALGKKALLIPSPGQAEQQYLAELAMTRKFALVQQQDELSLSQAWSQLSMISGFPLYKPDDRLQRLIHQAILEHETVYQ
ncbi:MAG: hypothetical protein N2044_03110 [Cyclobacteriaceae bacterium]|nr:hypothetical protein [Cyclobacteriaceae bacterium]MCX7636814.1 hypothetical protein [Cyclobacteriaceae bacterium]MDW8331295.1 glycosyltransferase [Cyclobacteriaceae bacterium]